MGYIRKHWVIFDVSAYPDEEPIKKFNEWLQLLPNDSRRFIYTNFDKMNGYKTVFMDWDGSKEGWDMSNEFDDLREDLRQALKANFEYIREYAVFDDEARDEPHLETERHDGKKQGDA